MVGKPLSTEAISAGRTFYEELRQLGLHPEGLCWAYDAMRDKHFLWLIWSGVDQFGPFEITKTLFRAFQASLFPSQINPFEVHVWSASNHVAQLYLKHPFPAEAASVVISGPYPERQEPTPNEHGFWIERAAIYARNGKLQNASRAANDWRRFQAAVQARAA